jgi:cell division protein ZapA
MSAVVHVDIHGHRYSVKSELDAQYVNHLAEFLDARMQAASREVSSADPTRIAVIAALNIADELYRSRADSAGVADRLLAKTAEIERIVDAVLTEDRPRLVVNE